MVGILRTNHAIILCALVTTEPVQSHVVSGLARELDALFVLLVIIRLARDYFKDVPALAFNQFWIIGRSNIQPSLLNIFPLFFPKDLFTLPTRYTLLTSSTVRLFKLELFLSPVYGTEVMVGHVFETLEVEGVKAVGGLEHADVLFYSVFFAEGFHAEIAHFEVFVVGGKVFFGEVL